jgi:hypothetical protein
MVKDDISAISLSRKCLRVEKYFEARRGDERKKYIGCDHIFRIQALKGNRYV